MQGKEYRLREFGENNAKNNLRLVSQLLSVLGRKPMLTVVPGINVNVLIFLQTSFVTEEKEKLRI